MPVALNISRVSAEDETFLSQYILPEDQPNWVFICINSPGERRTNLPVWAKDRLDLFFWDLTEAKGGKYDRIPEPIDAGEIIQFLIKHKGKNVCSHCTAGVSRSGAITDFLVTNLGYTSPTTHYAMPNTLLLQYLIRLFERHKGKL